MQFLLCSNDSTDRRKTQVFLSDVVKRVETQWFFVLSVYQRDGQIIEWSD